MSSTSTDQSQIAYPVAKALLQAGCVSFRVDNPFRLPSGWASPVYMDCRKLISFPAFRSELVRLMIDRLRVLGRLQTLDSITGAESSGIALAALIADKLNLPMQYVRKRSVGFSHTSQVEGAHRAGDRTVLIDDLMAAGHSKVKFCEAMRAAGYITEDIVVVFDYNTFPTAELLRPLGVAVHALCTWQDISRALHSGELPQVAEQDLLELDAFLAEPTEWSGAHGGISRLNSGRRKIGAGHADSASPYQTVKFPD